MMNEDILLSIDGLTQRFKVGGRVTEALAGVSLDIRRAEVLGLVGESGSGKSTIGRIISGIYEPSGGTVSYGGEIIRMGREEIRARIRAKRREAARKIYDLRVFLNCHRVDRDSIKNDINYVKYNLQNDLKSDYYDLSVADKVFRKWHRKPHPEIRMVFQDPSASLNPRMTVAEIIGEALYAVGERDRTVIEGRVREVLSSVGLPLSAMAKYPHEFSGGQRQRVGIARAVITHPALLIADEPVSALDVSVGAQVVNLICDLARDMAISVLFIAHDLSLVEHISDRVGVMYRGRIVELAPSRELFKNPLHPYTRALLSAIPPPDPRLARSTRRLSYSCEGAPSGELVDVGGGHLVLKDIKEKSGGDADGTQSAADG